MSFNINSYIKIKNFKNICCLGVVCCFLSQQIALGAPSVLPTPSKPLTVQINPSFGHIDEFYQGDLSKPSLILIQDAHTNASAQLNVSHLLEGFIQQHSIDTVFLEAGSGDLSLKALRRSGDAKTRRDVALGFVKKGILQGTEYLQLTSEYDFDLYGVEEAHLYDQSLDVFRSSMMYRKLFASRWHRARVLGLTLASEILDPRLTEFIRFQQRYANGEVGPIGYATQLLDWMQMVSQEESWNRDLTALMEIKNLESQIDFDLAIDELNVLYQKPENQKNPFLTELIGHIQQGNHETLVDFVKRQSTEDVFVLFQQSKQLGLYGQYLQKMATLDFSNVWAQVERVERAYARKLIVSETQRRLYMSLKQIEAFKKLSEQKLTPQENYLILDATRKWQQLTAFLNTLAAERRLSPDLALLFESKEDEWVSTFESFYDLTLQRDHVFLRNIAEKMKQGHKNKAVFVAGGYHTANLKQLLQQRGWSYTVITPNVHHETDFIRYERLLMEQARIGGSPSASLRVRSDLQSTMMLRQVQTHRGPLRLATLRQAFEHRSEPHDIKISTFQSIGNYFYLLAGISIRHIKDFVKQTQFIFKKFIFEITVNQNILLNDSSGVSIISSVVSAARLSGQLATEQGENRRPAFEITPENILVLHKDSDVRLEKQSLQTAFQHLPDVFTDAQILLAPEDDESGIVILSNSPFINEAATTIQNAQILSTYTVSVSQARAVNPEALSKKQIINLADGRGKKTQSILYAPDRVDTEDLQNGVVEYRILASSKDFDRVKALIEKHGLDSDELKKVSFGSVHLNGLSEESYRRGFWGELLYLLEIAGIRNKFEATLTERDKESMREEDSDHEIMQEMIHNEAFMSDVLMDLFGRSDIPFESINTKDVEHIGQGGFRRVYRVNMRIAGDVKAYPFVIKIVQANVTKSDSDQQYDINYVDRLTEVNHLMRSHVLQLMTNHSGPHLIEDFEGRDRIVMSENYVEPTKANISQTTLDHTVLEAYLKQFLIHQHHGQNAFMEDPKRPNAYVMRKARKQFYATIIDHDNMHFERMGPANVVHQFLNYGFLPGDIISVVIKVLGNREGTVFLKEAAISFNIRFTTRGKEYLDAFKMHLAGGNQLQASEIEYLGDATNAYLEKIASGQVADTARWIVPDAIPISVNGIKKIIPENTRLIDLLKDFSADYQAVVVKVNKDPVASDNPKSRRKILENMIIQPNDEITFSAATNIVTKDEPEEFISNEDALLWRHRNDFLESQGFDKKLVQLKRLLAKLSRPNPRHLHDNGILRLVQSDLRDALKLIDRYRNGQLGIDPVNLDSYNQAFKNAERIDFVTDAIRQKYLDQFTNLRNLAIGLKEESDNATRQSLLFLTNLTSRKVANIEPPATTGFKKGADGARLALEKRAPREILVTNQRARREVLVREHPAVIRFGALETDRAPSAFQIQIVWDPETEQHLFTVSAYGGSIRSIEEAFPDKPLVIRAKAGKVLRVQKSGFFRRSMATSQFRADRAIHFTIEKVAGATHQFVIRNLITREVESVFQDEETETHLIIQGVESEIFDEFIHYERVAELLEYVLEEGLSDTQIVAAINNLNEALPEIYLPFIPLALNHPFAHIDQVITDQMSLEELADFATRAQDSDETIQDLHTLFYRLARYARSPYQGGWGGIVNPNLAMLPVLVGLIHPSPLLRAVAMDFFSAYQVNERQRDSLVRILSRELRNSNSPNYVRQAAIHALQHFDGEDEIIEALEREIRYDPNSQQEDLVPTAFLISALQKLLIYSEPASVVIVAAFMSSENERVRDVATSVYALIADMSIEASTLRLNIDAEERENAIQQLSQRPSSYLKNKTMVHALSDPSGRVTEIAIDSITQDPSFPIQPILQTIRNPEPLEGDRDARNLDVNATQETYRQSARLRAAEALALKGVSEELSIDFLSELNERAAAWNAADDHRIEELFRAPYPLGISGDLHPIEVFVIIHRLVIRDANLPQEDVAANPFRLTNDLLNALTELRNSQLPAVSALLSLDLPEGFRLSLNLQDQANIFIKNNETNLAIGARLAKKTVDEIFQEEIRLTNIQYHSALLKRLGMLFSGPLSLLRTHEVSTAEDIRELFEPFEEMIYEGITEVRVLRERMTLLEGDEAGFLSLRATDSPDCGICHGVAWSLWKAMSLMRMDASVPVIDLGPDFTSHRYVVWNNFAIDLALGQFDSDYSGKVFVHDSVAAHHAFVSQKIISDRQRRVSQVTLEQAEALRGEYLKLRIQALKAIRDASQDSSGSRLAQFEHVFASPDRLNALATYAFQIAGTHSGEIRFRAEVVPYQPRLFELAGKTSPLHIRIVGEAIEVSSDTQPNQLSETTIPMNSESWLDIQVKIRALSDARVDTAASENVLLRPYLGVVDLDGLIGSDELTSQRLQAFAKALSQLNANRKILLTGSEFLIRQLLNAIKGGPTIMSSEAQLSVTDSSLPRTYLMSRQSIREANISSSSNRFVATEDIENNQKEVVVHVYQPIVRWMDALGSYQEEQGDAVTRAHVIHFHHQITGLNLTVDDFSNLLKGDRDTALRFAIPAASHLALNLAVRAYQLILRTAGISA